MTRGDWLLEQLHDWLPNENAVELTQRVRTAVERIARRVMLERQREPLRI